MVWFRTGLELNRTSFELNRTEPCGSVQVQPIVVPSQTMRLRFSHVNAEPNQNRTVATLSGSQIFESPPPHNCGD
jgi:hypothetical protein